MRAALFSGALAFVLTALVSLEDNSLSYHGDVLSSSKSNTNRFVLGFDFSFEGFNSLQSGSKDVPISLCLSPAIPY